jgi:hypothetical protein
MLDSNTLPNSRLQLFKILARHSGPHGLLVEYVLPKRLRPALLTGGYHHRLAVVYKFKGIKAQNCHDDSKKVKLVLLVNGKSISKTLFSKYPEKI